MADKRAILTACMRSLEIEQNWAIRGMERLRHNAEALGIDPATITPAE